MKGRTWKVRWLPEAERDLDRLDRSVRLRVFKAVLKLEKDPTGYGEPLGRKAGLDLAGLWSIEPAPGYRLVYYVLEERVLVAVVAAGKREEMKVYRDAAKRAAKYKAMIKREIQEIGRLLKDVRFE